MGGHGQPVGPPHLWPYFLGNPQGLDTGETLESPQTLISPYIWVREPPEKGLQGIDCDYPLEKPLLSWFRTTPAPAKAAPGHPHRHSMTCLG